MSDAIYLADKAFLLLIEKLEDYMVEGEIKKVVAWEAEDMEPAEFEPYLQFYLKWDGCCHLWFGDEEKRDGYLHLCDRRGWERHCQMMTELYEWSVKVIPHHVDKGVNNAKA